MSAVIYHNAACSKSRGALDILTEQAVDAVVIDYQATPPSVADLERLQRLLGLPALAMVRTTDALFRELGLAVSDQRDDRGWFELIRRHPLLLQRPIVVIGDRAVIARPSERVREILP